MIPGLTGILAAEAVVVELRGVSALSLFTQTDTDISAKARRFSQLHATPNLVLQEPLTVSGVIGCRQEYVLHHAALDNSELPAGSRPTQPMAGRTAMAAASNFSLAM